MALRESLERLVLESPELISSKNMQGELDALECRFDRGALGVYEANLLLLAKTINSLKSYKASNIFKEICNATFTFDSAEPHNYGFIPYSFDRITNYFKDPDSNPNNGILAEKNSIFAAIAMYYHGLYQIEYAGTVDINIEAEDCIKRAAALFASASEYAEKTDPMYYNEWKARALFERGKLQKDPSDLICDLNNGLVRMELVYYLNEFEHHDGGNHMIDEMIGVCRFALNDVLCRLPDENPNKCSFINHYEMLLRKYDEMKGGSS